MADTALARQLKKLAVPQTTILIQDKIRKSFLFDHRDAAGLDRELIFAYGTTGLQKLCTINPLFFKFDSTLFSLNYKDFERSVQNSSVNQKLDDKISEFLRLLSPYFLMREAHEALEWLVYRFHIHMYNVDDLIACALPHYNTSYFVRVVQLLDLDLKSRWVWLKPIQKTGVHLDYTAILNCFLKDTSFQKFVCDIGPNVLNMCKDHETIAVPVISFSMLTIRNALERCKVIDNKLVTSLFPYILSGLSSNLTTYTLGSYMVISQIMLKVKLSSEIVDELLIKIFKMLKPDLKKEATMILHLIFQSQSIKSLPKKVYSVILSSMNTVRILLNSLNTFKGISLIQAIIKRTIFMLFMSTCTKGKKSQKILKFFCELLNSVSLDEKCVSFSFNCILKKYSKSTHDKKSVKHSQKIVECVLKNLEQKYPDHFDKAYRKFLEKSHPNKKMLCRLISNSLCSVKYEVVPNVLTSLTLGVYHVNPNIRLSSLVYLQNIITKNDFAEKEFIKKCVSDRLLDDNPKVVLVILSSADTFLSLLSKSEVLSAFKSIFTRQITLHSEWYIVQMKCLDIIMKLFTFDDIYDVLEIMLNFIFPVNEHTVEGFFCVLKSEVNDRFLQKFVQCMNSKFAGMEGNAIKNFSEINCMVIKCVEEFTYQMDEESRVKFSSLLKSKITDLKSSPLLVFYIHVMQFILTKNEGIHNLSYINDLLQVFKLYFSQSNIMLDLNDLLKFIKSCFSNSLKILDSSDMSLEKFKELLRDYTFIKYLDSLNKQQFPATLIFYTIIKIVTGIKLNIECKSWPSIDNDYSHSYEILSRLFYFCVMYLNSDKGLLQEYFNVILSLLITCQLKNVQSTFWFLSTKWISSSGNLAVQVTSTSIAIALISGKEQMDWLFDNSMIFLCLIKLIGNPDEKLRFNALNLLHLCLSSTKNCVYPLKLLGEEIISKLEEIKTDYRQCFDCVGIWLNDAVENMNAKKSKHVRTELKAKISVLNLILGLLNKNEIPFSIKYFLLSCLQNADTVTVLSSCIPVLYNHLSLLEEINVDNEYIFKILHLSLKKFTPKTAVCLIDNSPESKVLLHCLNFIINRENGTDRRVQMLALDVLSKKFFAAIPSILVQQEILDRLLTFYMTSQINVSSKVEEVLRRICSYAYLFFKYLKDQELSGSKSATLREVKKVKTKENDTNNLSTLEGDIWKKVTVFLELIQGESNFLHKEILISELFNLLNKSLDFDSQAQIEYIKQLILSAIYNCCEQFDSQLQLEQYFQVELIVQCIRSSSNTKTNRQALMLLNLAAALFPDYVLKNVMSIFVFMGSSLVRQDNSHSFQVISQTIEKVLPSLCEASHQQTKTDGDQVVASIIRVFVDSLLDIPGHRQLPLFTKLINTLDPSKYLWVPLGQICDQYATVFHNISPDDTTNWKVSPTLDFAVNLHKQFSPDIQINTCIKLVDFLVKLPDTKKQLELNPDKYEKMKEPFNVVGHNDIELQIYKHNVLSYMKIWLSSQAFHSQVSYLSVKEKRNLEEKYEQLLGSILTFLQDRLSIKKQDKDGKSINDQVQLLYGLVYAINSLLPCNLFIQVMRRLLKSEEREIQLRALELLSTKLEQQTELFGPENRKLLLKLLKPLLKLIDTCQSESDNEKCLSIQQSALYALHILCKLIGTEYPSKFYKILQVAVSVLSKSTQPQLIVNALLCLAQLCHCLNVDILSHLNSFMPTVMNILQDENVLEMDDCYILGIATAMEIIIENIGMFLSSYMEGIITSICVFSVKYSKLGKKSVFENLQTKLSNEIPLRVLLPAIESSYLKLSLINTNAVVPLMKILTQNLDSSKYEDILSCAIQLQNFYLTLLNFRNCNQQLQSESVILVENSIISSLQTFVMKLSVTRFRTFFQKIYQWAVKPENDKEQKYRIFTFYKLTSELSKSLKSLFSLMSKYLFTHISSTLNSCNVILPEPKTHYFECRELFHELLNNVLDTLKFSFMYSEEQLLDKENFNGLMDHLVNQIENVDYENEDDVVKYQDVIKNHLSSCIAYFMTAVSDSALWKALNNQILPKVRHVSPTVCTAALQIILEVVKKMGDNYLVLFPESYPILMEVMEDNSSDVERECQKVMNEIQELLGEPISNYI